MVKSPPQGSKELATPINAGDKDIESQDYFHGLVAKEDVDGMLEDNGDFVCPIGLQTGRAYQKEKKKGKKEEAKKWEVKEYIIVREGNKFSLGKQPYDSIVLLIDDLFNKKTTLPKKGVPRPSWELKHDWAKYDESKVLGTGQFGKVYKGELTVPGKKSVKVAIKVANNDEDHKTLADTLKEARAMRNIDHPNIVKFMGIVIECDPVMLVIELVNLGCLAPYLKTNGPVPTELKHKFALHAAWGIEYLHQKKVIHRDIAARNCLLHKAKEDSEEITVKIADFGLSRLGEFYQIHGRRCLPVHYLPNEANQKGLFNSMTDCWMFGALLFEIYSDGQPLYKGLKSPQIVERISKHDLQPIPEDFPAEAKQLIGNCWQKNPKDRITMKAAAETLEKLTDMKAPLVCNPEMMRKKTGKKTQLLLALPSFY